MIYSSSVAQEKELTPKQIKAKKRFETTKRHFLNSEYTRVIAYYDSILKKQVYTHFETYKMANESYSQLALTHSEDSETYSNLAEEAFNQAQKWFGKMQVADRWDSLKIELNQQEQVGKDSYQKPDFPGGMSAFYEYIRQELKYPQEAKEMGITGKVYVVFMVNKDGSIDAVNAINKLGGGCEEEAVRVITNAPHFIPGQRGGEPTYVRMRLPLVFDLIEEASSGKTKKQKRKKRKRG